MNSQKLFDAPTKMSIVTTKVTKTIVASSYKNREKKKNLKKKNEEAERHLKKQKMITVK